MGSTMLEHKLRQLDLNILKGIIGEHLARSFIRNKLAVQIIEEEGWSHVILDGSNYRQRYRKWKTGNFSFCDLREDFHRHGFYPSKRLVSKYANTLGILARSHCTPDGLLLKLLETGQVQTPGQEGCQRTLIVNTLTSGDNALPVVEGDLEVVEIKSGRSAKLVAKQKEAYNRLISRDVPVRIVRVKIVSFDMNSFLVEATKVENPL